MNDLFLEAFNAVSGDDFEERPVEIETFVTSDKFLGLPPLSDYQYQMIRAGSQIYKYETLLSLYGEEKARKRYAQTCKEVVLQLGKGSGKDYTSTISCAYIVYLLLCLKDPAAYYNKPKDDTIDIINVAVNSDQAKNVFFKNLKTRIKNCPWFAGKYGPPTQYSIEFDKNINVYSGHSERESFEGLNLIYAVLDEISAFALESATGNEQANTAQAVYDTYRDSVDSRFPDFGKVLLLSFPRFKDDFIQQRYEAVIAEKEVIIRRETLKLDPDLPDGTEGNEFDVEWEEDHIVSYKFRNIFALRRPTWEVNPQRKITDFTRNFFENMGNALGKYACMPSNLENGFFKNKAAIEAAFVTHNGVDEDGVFLDRFQPREETKYFIHVDLAQKHDHCVVAMAHVDKWVDVKIGSEYSERHPVVVIDCIRWWTPTKQNTVDFQDVRDFIVALRRRGFEIRLATFDRWNCVRGDALVHTPRGPVQMKSISVGDELTTRHGTAKVGAKSNAGVQEVFRVTTRLGWEFEATINHRVLTRRGWVTIGELTDADEMLLDNSYDFSGVDIINEEQAYVLGGLIADGWVNDKNDHQINFTTSDSEFAERMHKALVNEWGFKNTVQVSLQEKTAGSTVDTHTYTYWDKDMIVRMRNAGLSRAIAGDKRIPSSVLSGSKEVRAAFFAGYIDGDGGIQTYVDKSGTTRYRLTVDTISEALIKDLVWVSMSLSLEPTRLRQRRSNPEREVHRLTFEGRKAERLLAVVKPAIGRKASIDLTKQGSPAERWSFANNQLWVKVRKIETVGYHETFDISVPEYEEFILDGFVTHNSHDTMNILENEHGIHTELLSVDKKHYDDYLSIMYDRRLIGPKVQLLIDELTELRALKRGTKIVIDHPRKGTKDFSDATCGAIFNAITHTPPPVNQEVDIVSLYDLAQRYREEQRIKSTPEPIGIISDPRHKIPNELKDYLEAVRLL